MSRRSMEALQYYVQGLEFKDLLEQEEWNKLSKERQQEILELTGANDLDGAYATYLSLMNELREQIDKNLFKS